MSENLDAFEALMQAEELDRFAESIGLSAGLVCLPGQHQKKIGAYDLIGLSEDPPVIPAGWFLVPGHLDESNEEALHPVAVYDPDDTTKVAVCVEHYQSFTGQVVPS